MRAKESKVPVIQLPLTVMVVTKTTEQVSAAI